MKHNNDSQKGWQMAITFAEAGEWDTARSMMPTKKRSGIERLFDYFTAVAYAEEGMVDEALRLIDAKPREPRGFLDVVGLSQIRVTYAHIPAAA